MVAIGVEEYGEGIPDDEAQSGHARGVAGCSRRTAGTGKGADPPRRPARGRAARTALGTDREGIQLRHRRRATNAARAFRRALAADRLSLHVRPVVTGGVT